MSVIDHIKYAKFDDLECKAPSESVLDLAGREEAAASPNDRIDALTYALARAVRPPFDVLWQRFMDYQQEQIQRVFRLPAGAIGESCACGQQAMMNHELCADCRTIAEDADEVEPQATEPRRPQDDLDQWRGRPLGTIGEGWRR